jgi:hypothetical protein
MDTTIAPYWLQMLPGMFPMFEEALGEANEKHYRIMAALDFIRPENWVEGFRTGPGRQKMEREKFLRAFIAKTILNISTVVGLIDRLKVDPVLKRICGWIFKKTIPCEASFSNAFNEFSESGICERIHAEMVKKSLQDTLVFHVSRDSTAILARESAALKPKPIPKIKRPRGRPKKGEIVAPKVPTRLESQRLQTLSEMLERLHGPADFGAKLDSHGNQHSWLGYKLHLDVCDGGVPISYCLTPASVHDSGASKPLQRMTSSRVTALYIVADKAYSAKEIKDDIREHGQVPIIPNKKAKNGESIDLEWFEKVQIERTKHCGTSEFFLKGSFWWASNFCKGSKKSNVPPGLWDIGTHLRSDHASTLVHFGIFD